MAPALKTLAIASTCLLATTVAANDNTQQAPQEHEQRKLTYWHPGWGYGGWGYGGWGYGGWGYGGGVGVGVGVGVRRHLEENHDEMEDQRRLAEEHAAAQEEEHRKLTLWGPEEPIGVDLHVPGNENVGVGAKDPLPSVLRHLSEEQEHSQRRLRALEN